MISVVPKPAPQTPGWQQLSADEQSVYLSLDPARLPRHIAIIMDGNGRWAGRRSLARFLGHQQGAESVQFVVETAARIGIPWMTLYAFSLENNLRRPRTEVGFLMKLLKSYLTGNIKRMHDNNIRIAYIGRIKELPADVQETMLWAQESTARNTGTTLTLALNYGSRTEMVDAMGSVLAVRLRQAKAAGLSLDDIIAHPPTLDESDLASALYTAGMPDPDLIIRTSGEQRISNFLLWQMAYSEIYVTDRLWPDFRGIHLLEAIQNYQQRERRFGGLGESKDGPQSLPDGL